MADDNLMNEFFIDTQGHLDQIEEGTLSLEHSPDDTEIIGDVFRRVHSIKGNAGIMGLGDIYAYGQEFEAFLEGIRERKIVTAPEIEQIFKHLDRLKALMLSMRSEEGGEEPQDDQAYIDQSPAYAEDDHGADDEEEEEHHDMAAPVGAPARSQALSGQVRQAQAEVRRPEKGNGHGPVTVLTFQIGDEIYGFDIMKVKEIITYERVTRVPNTKWYVDGVMNLRDQVIPVFDLKKKLKFKEASSADVDREKSIIVVEIQKVLTGLAVDEVTGIRVFEHGKITPPSDFTGKISSEFLVGVGQMEQGAVIILNAPDICDPQEILY
ncbi:MAG: chemotaxis protein CheW [Nitrospinota bacterium]|nr:chemotaxis protein CheW [Nitrospinota bacterium]MDH5678214.1 chemotaxis protein CheW [Nitrospinota bacterium]MDH5756063.1 chemotaxis protein CheW [Nitrospinota bacterium]